MAGTASGHYIAIGETLLRNLKSTVTLLSCTRIPTQWPSIPIALWSSEVTLRLFLNLRSLCIWLIVNRHAFTFHGQHIARCNFISQMQCS